MLYDWSTVVIVFFFLVGVGIKALPGAMRHVTEAISIWNNRSQPVPVVPVTSVPATPAAVPAVTVSSSKTESVGNLPFLSSNRAVTA